MLSRKLSSHCHAHGGPRLRSRSRVLLHRVRVYSMVYSELCYSMSCVTVAVKIRENATLENCTNEARLEMPPALSGNVSSSESLDARRIGCSGQRPPPGRASCSVGCRV